jgi:hypothetical protein
MLIFFASDICETIGFALSIMSWQLTDDVASALKLKAGTALATTTAIRTIDLIDLDMYFPSLELESMVDTRASTTEDAS